MATAADGQLRFEISDGIPAISEAGEVDLVDAVILASGGDARVAIRELLADVDFLRDQLYTASCLMSRGIAYGWRPKYERV